MKKEIKIILGVIVILLLSIFTFYNYRKCPPTFFNATLIDILNLVFIVVFTYFLVEMKSTQRKRKECIENLIDKLSNILDDTRLYKIDSEDNLRHVRITQRSITSKIEVLKKFDCEDIKNDINYIGEQFESYWDIVSDYIDNIDKLKDSSITLMRHINNMQNKLDVIIIKLY